MARTTRLGQPQPLTKSERARKAVLARLLNEPWETMTEKANASERHVGSLDRWTAQARAANPALDDVQAARLAQQLRAEHFRQLGKRSGEARRAKAS